MVGMLVSRSLRKLTPLVVLTALLLTMGSWGGMPHAIAAGDWYVNPGESIQVAIDAAYAAGGGTVHVAAGTYHELITLKNGVLVQGAGATATTISGDTNSDGTGDGSVVTALNVNSTAGLDGLTITDGTGTLADFEGYDYKCGGGMLNNNSSPTLTNCTFTQNNADCGGGMYNYYSSLTLRNCTFSGNNGGCGAGMDNNNSSPTLTDCTFSGNELSYPGWEVGSGGGMSNSNSSPTLTNCTFSGNRGVESYGGGMSNYGLSPTLTNCSFYGNSAMYGGGLYNSGSSPALTNCAFSGNTVGRTDGDPGLGGGIANYYSSPTVTGCSFSENEGPYGGGMYNCNSSPQITNCTFSTNSSTFDMLGQDANGGGMYNCYGSSPQITDCTFSGNSVMSDGGGMANYDSSPTLTNCTFSGNHAGSGDDYGGWGGGMYNSGGSPTLTNCTFSGNNAGPYGGGCGGGMYITTSSATLTNCIFTGNGVLGDGGGIFATNSSLTLTSCSFSGNHALDMGWGGGISCGSQTFLTNCTFSGNDASYGGGIGTSGSPTLTNCTFFGNDAFDGHGMYTSGSPILTNCILWGDGVQISGGSPVVTYCDVAGGYSGTGNIGLDPLFLDADGPDNVLGTADDNLRLSPGSPCIDAGSNSAPSLPANDFEGDYRIIDGDNDGTATVDMGADEAQWAADTTPPTAITNLAATAVTSASATLTWTAPGDDGNTGTASTYDIRYSTSTITNANWALASQCSGEAAPKAAGSAETFTVTGLSPNTLYYFAMKTADEVSNWSALSNVPNKVTATVITHSISGTVTLSGSGLQGVTMTLSGAASTTTTTDASGNYAFTELANGSYTITPSLSAYSFNPTSSAQVVSGANVTGVNFTATKLTYSLAGRVTLSGAGLQGVTIALSGAASTSATTDAYGIYRFEGLTNGSYVVAPSKSGYTFSPTSLSRTVNGANITGVNFTATALTYNLSGRVTLLGAGLQGVTVTLSGATSASTTTDASGNYTFSNLMNGSYTVTPSKSGYTFNPTSSARTVAGSAITGVNFAAAIVTYSLSGRVTLAGAGLQGVTIALTGAASATTTTDAYGNYLFSNLANGSYSVAPSKSGYTFSPTSSARMVSGADLTGVNFTAAATKPPILLVHGFQATDGWTLDGYWWAMAMALTGRDVTKSGDYTWVWNEKFIYPLKRVEGRGSVVYISNYTHMESSKTNRDIREYACNLAKEIQLVKEHEVVSQVDIVAHSMGGLVSRAYIENQDFRQGNEWPVEYNKDVRRLLMLGTPNGGTPLADWLPDFFVRSIAAQQMQPGSPFLQELNGLGSATGYKNGVEYSAVAGTYYECSCGTLFCDAKPSDGSEHWFTARKLCSTYRTGRCDGVVHVNSVQLGEISTVRWFEVPLNHTDIAKYTYELVNKILASRCFGGETIEIPKTLVAKKLSPGELRLYDSEGRVTGLVNGVVVQEIPNSWFDVDDDCVVVLPAIGEYRCEVVGSSEGTYGLLLTYGDAGEVTHFTTVDTPLALGAIHEYTVDWYALSQGDVGTTVRIDVNGDGKFDKKVRADTELTADEFALAKSTGGVTLFWVWIAVGIGVVSVGGGGMALWLWIKKRKPATVGLN